MPVVESGAEQAAEQVFVRLGLTFFHYAVVENRGAERCTGGEHFRVMQRVKERTVATHRKPGNGAELLTAAGTVGLFDIGDQLFKEHIFVRGFAIVLVDVPGIPGIGHHDDHL